MAAKGIPAPLALLIGCALLLRALIPAGWMPASGRGFGIELCGGTAAQQLRHQAMAGHAKDGKSQGEDQPCAFAAFAMASTGPQDWSFAPPALAPSPLPSPAPATSVGQGLAAPPPPSTGPPARA